MDAESAAAASEEALVELALAAPVATITLHRPRKLNALNPEMLALLDAIVARLERDTETRVVVLTGAGERAFCVGADITAWSALQPLEMWRWWVRDGHRVFERLARLPQPVIAVLNGPAFGGGLELALAADLRLAHDGVELAMPEVKLGTVPGWAATQRLPALIGPARAKEMIFSGRRIDAPTAERWGLLNAVVAREDLPARAQELALEIAANAPVSVQLAKGLVDGTLGLSNAVTLEALAGALAATTADAREGLDAHGERRPPDFQGC